MFCGVRKHKQRREMQWPKLDTHSSMQAAEHAMNQRVYDRTHLGIRVCVFSNTPRDNPPEDLHAFRGRLQNSLWLDLGTPHLADSLLFCNILQAI